MGITGSSKTNIFSRRVLSQTSLGPNMLGFLETVSKRSFKMITTGVSAADNPGAFFEAPTVTDGAVGSTLDFGALYGTDGTGESFDLEITDPDHAAYFIAVPFEDTLGFTYYLGVKQIDLPQGISFDTTTGILGFDSYKKTLGCPLAPISVVDNGDGTVTITFTLIDAGDDYTGRSVQVNLATPVDLDASVSIQTGTVSVDSVTVPQFGADGRFAYSRRLRT